MWWIILFWPLCKKLGLFEVQYKKSSYRILFLLADAGRVINHIDKTVSALKCRMEKGTIVNQQDNDVRQTHHDAINALRAGQNVSSINNYKKSFRTLLLHCFTSLLSQNLPHQSCVCMLCSSKLAGRKIYRTVHGGSPCWHHCISIHTQVTTCDCIICWWALPLEAILPQFWVCIMWPQACW